MSVYFITCRQMAQRTLKNRIAAGDIHFPFRAKEEA